jgi:acetyl/propionyl-CoA carboxylase alpha subunit
VKRLLIANRGEIACRIIKSAREMGLECLAVYSKPDAKAKHVELADQSRSLGPGKAKESYLAVDKILQAAKEMSADAVHPGYGFLAENAEFARKVLQQGMIWVGPTPENIETMGDKQRAKELAQMAGIPVLNGSTKFKENQVSGLKDVAEKIGFPLLVKASAGGGGIGMKPINSMDKLHGMVEDTQRLAKQSFGDGTIFLEKLIQKARHIEIQIFGFGKGHTIHMFERDCSVQRRFQKIIEESPAVGLPEKIRQKMAADAVSLANKVDYRGAGTVEFIVDTENYNHYFLEMNTRIQVEHPITEMNTDLDLVTMQLEFAAGNLEHISQKNISFIGHSIECRIYAENPTINFIPSPGLLKVLKFPNNQQGLRIDCGYKQGDQVSYFYDPMVAKVITHGENRVVAIERMLAVLNTSKVEGITTNIPFLISILKHRDFSGYYQMHTGFVEENRTQLI